MHGVLGQARAARDGGHTETRVHEVQDAGMRRGAAARAAREHQQGGGQGEDGEQGVHGTPARAPRRSRNRRSALVRIWEMRDSVRCRTSPICRRVRSS